MPPYAPIEERFATKYEPEPNSGCWLWTAAREQNGYGKIGIGPGHSNRSMLAHRVSYELHVGPIPPGLHILHRCDTPACVNPAHLFAGTHADNMADCASKRRSVIGERNGQARLRREDVAEIRQLVADGYTQVAVAQRFGVSNSHVCSLVSGRFWRHA